MINPYSLLAMQYGGTAGGATLARALQQRSDADTLEEYQKAEAERQKRGRLFGSVGGLGAGLLGAALAPATGGLSLALASGVGTAFGKGVGERLGAGGARGVDRSGTVYGQKAFRDVAEASKEYNRGIAGRAGMAGLKAGLTAGLAPGGGMYGKVAGKLRPQDVLTASQTALPSASQAALEAGQQMGAEQGAGLTFGRGGDAISRSFGLSDPAQATQYLAPQGSVLDLAQQGQGFVSDPSAIIGDTAQAVSGGAAPLFGSLSEAIAARGAGDPRAQALINQAYEGTGGDWAQAKQQFGSIFGVEDGGLIGMQDGGYGGYSTNVVDILENAGLDATPQQLKLFEEFDPTQLQQVAEGLQEGLLSGTLGAADTTATMGFQNVGAVTHAQEQQRKAAGEQFTSAKTEAAKEFESQTLGQAAEQIAGGAEFKELRRGSWDPPTAPSGFTYGDTPPPMGHVHIDNSGVTWVWGYTDIMNKVTGWNRQGQQRNG